jgi:hypothetical protein
MDCRFVDLWIWKPDSAATECSPVADIHWRRYWSSVSVKAGYLLSRWAIISCERIVHNRKLRSFLGELAKLRKATISFVVSVRLSVRPSACPRKQLCSHWTNLYEIWCLSIFRKSVEKIQDSLKSGKNNRYFTWRIMHIFNHISLTSS